MINRSEILGMIDHWLRTPPNGYVGSSYGAPLEELLLYSQSTNIADNFINKMKSDLPILSQLNSTQFSIYTEEIGFEKKIVYFQVGTIAINLTQVSQDSLASSGETYNANAG